MRKNTDLISSLSSQSKTSSKLKDANNPLVRKNKQLEVENEKLSLKNEELDQEISSLKLSLSDVVESGLNQAHADKIIKMNRTIDGLRSELENQVVVISELTSSKQASSFDFNHYLTLDLSANAIKFLKAISSHCLTKNAWFKISGRHIKRDYNVHENFFKISKDELVSKGLIEVKEGKIGKRSFWEYKKLF